MSYTKLTYAPNGAAATLIRVYTGATAPDGWKSNSTYGWAGEQKMLGKYGDKPSNPQGSGLKQNKKGESWILYGLYSHFLYELKARTER